MRLGSVGASHLVLPTGADAAGLVGDVVGAIAKIDVVVGLPPSRQVTIRRPLGGERRSLPSDVAVAGGVDRLERLAAGEAVALLRGEVGVGPLVVAGSDDAAEEAGSEHDDRRDHAGDDGGGRGRVLAEPLRHLEVLERVVAIAQPPAECGGDEDEPHGGHQTVAATVVAPDLPESRAR